MISTYPVSSYKKHVLDKIKTGEQDKKCSHWSGTTDIFVLNKDGNHTMTKSNKGRSMTLKGIHRPMIIKAVSSRMKLRKLRLFCHVLIKFPNEFLSLYQKASTFFIWLRIWFIRAFTPFDVIIFFLLLLFLILMVTHFLIFFLKCGLWPQYGKANWLPH